MPKIKGFDPDYSGKDYLEINIKHKETKGKPRLQFISNGSVQLVLAACTKTFHVFRPADTNYDDLLR